MADKSLLAMVQVIMDRVYSPYTGPAWRPRAFQGRSRRYLWSDAYGVCNYLSLYDTATEDERKAQLLDQADALIRDVHEVLGCYRDSRRRLEGFSLAEPTRGGLRIGKEDEQEDGQYFHYLTKWMFALSRMSIARDDPKYTQWAVQLAETAHRSFVIRGLGERPLRMVWKMAVDLQHVAVASEGNLDPFDGLVTYRLLQHQSADKSVLQSEIADMSHLVERKLAHFTTNDELDSGEALWLAEWFRAEPWARALHSAALKSVNELFATGRFEYPAAYRLLFREMGTVLGLKVASLDNDREMGTVLGLKVASLDNDRERWDARVEKLLGFWSDKVFNRDADISPLMYASALLPGVWDPHERRG
ncbi:hypothetical protein Gpo141_00004378 [Globisporangium polare]